MAKLRSQTRRRPVPSRRHRIAPYLEILDERALPAVNPIVAENLLPGTPQSQWLVTGDGDPTLQGFTTDISVNHGQTLSFKINNTALAPYHIDVYRLGYYGGNGARLVTTIPSSQTQAVAQPAALVDPLTGMIDAGNWSVTATWAVPATATSGLYAANLVREDTGGRSMVFFVVRADEGHSDILMQTSDATWQTYNYWGGTNLYYGNYSGSTGRGAGRSFAVSYNRPMLIGGKVGGYGTFNSPLHAELPMIAWLEQNGYDVSYFTNVDSDRYGSLIQNHRVFMSVGHDEYWSGQQRANVEAALGAGVNLAFMSGNEVYWKTRWSSSIDTSSTPYRSLVCYKESWVGQPIDPLSPGISTGTWRDPAFGSPSDGGRPENALTGTLYMNDRTSNDLGIPLNVPSDYSDLRFWRNTSVASLAPGQTTSLGQYVVGYETDEDVDNGSRPAGLMRMSSTTFNSPNHVLDATGTLVGPGTSTHTLTLYRASSGALVFGAGTVQWSWGLSNLHLGGYGATADPAIQQATINLLADMYAQPQSLQAGLVRATPSTDVTRPSSIVAAPINGGAVTAGTTLTISGTASDLGGVVAGIEISTDGGKTWHPATGLENWSYTWNVTGLGPMTILSRAVDDSGNIEIPGSGATVTATLPPASTTGLVGAYGFNEGLGTTLTDLSGNGNNGTISRASWAAGISGGALAFNGVDSWVTISNVGSLNLSSGMTLEAWVKPAAATSNWSTVVMKERTGGLAYALYGSTVGTGPNAPSPPAAVVNRNGTDYSARGSSTLPVDSWSFLAGTYDGNVARFYLNGNLVRSTTVGGNLISSTGALRIGGNSIWGEYFNGLIDEVRVFNRPLSLGEITSDMNTPVGSNVLDATPPAGSIVSPAGGSSLAGVATLTAAASDNVQVASVQFLVNGQPLGSPVTSSPYSLTWDSRAFGNGSYVVSARIMDRAGNTTTTAAVTVTVANPPDASPPTLSIKNPPDGTRTGGTVIPWAVASDSLGVTGVQFLLNGSNFGPRITTAPYRMSWDTRTVADGTYTLTAIAYDAAGNQATTSETVVVDNTAPSVASQAPAPGGTGVPTSGTSLTVTLSEPIDVGSLSLSLSDPNGVAYPGAISLDASGRVVTFAVGTQLLPDTTYTARLSGVTDQAGNPLPAPYSWSFRTVSTITNATVFPATAVPGVASVSDTASVELGMKFQSSVAGYVTGVRFYKGPSNTGTHIGHLWSATGSLLATTTFTGETSAGWQQASFATPVPIAANTTYVISYLAPAGRYPADAQAFSSTVGVGVLRGLSSASSGGNGVYRYTTTGAFPNNSFNATNYWVDVVFSNTLPNVPPSLTARSPAPGATGVGAGSPVTATFNEPVRPETVSFELRDGNNNLIPASLAYNSSTFVATLTPLAPLAASTTYTATVNGALDLAGIAMVPASWSFTTVTDSVGPSVVSTTPASGESAVALGTAISVTFSEPVNPATINFFLEDVAENLIPASMTYDSLTYTATLTPSSPLAASTRYTAEVTGAQDLAGNPIAATASWEFVTSSANQVPTVLTTSPPNGAGNLSIAAVVSATFNQNVLPESIAFTLVDSNNVPVSVTLSYDAATRTVTLDPHISLAQGTTFTATISGARDAAGNEMAEPVSWSFTTGSYNTLWPSAAVPSVASSSDTSAVELGVKFRSDVAGTITGIRFYKGPGNTGTHVGRLWTLSGTLLATATFSGETASGWQQASFAAPVAIAANTVYVASYHAPSGGYSYDPRYFATAGVDAAPLHALANGVSGSNGLYGYGPSGTFPTGSFNSTNYWVDVVFASSGNGGTLTAPTVTSALPAANATAVPVSTTQVVANFSTGMSAITSFTLAGPSGVLVPGTIQAVSGTNSATFVLARTAQLAPETTYTASVYGIDTTRNAMAEPYTWSFTTAENLTGNDVTASLWPSAAVPSVASSSDTSAVELGVKFRSDVAGTITGIRFYKGPGNTGTHVGRLWTLSGTLLATATFSGETASGWQQASFAAPVAIAANTVYVASYHAPSGGYSYDPRYFATAGVDTAPLHALADGVSGGNGLYAYGPSGTFPTGSYNSANYWVDVVFSATTIASVLTVSDQTPAPNATNIPATTEVSATFSADVRPESISFVLRDSAGNAVSTGAISYNSITRVARMTPIAALAPSTTYTATIDASDTSGNLLDSPFSWSFTTADPGNGSYTLWNSSVTPKIVTSTDTSQLELGVKFRSDVAGTITGIRFYKGPGNTGTHVGRLWDSGGNLLATATFSGETSSGWQQVSFATPVAIAANTVYVASYSAPVGGYSYDSAYFATVGVDSGPLHALADGASGGNGVYGSIGSFPRSSFNSNNYWVDVVFTSGPTVVGQVPTPNAQNVSASTTITATFSTPMVLPGTLNFVLKDPSGAVVPASYAYTSSTSVVLTPNTSLAGATTYTVSVSGAADSQGNVMVPSTWSFTTAGSTSSLWGNTAVPANPTANDNGAVELGVKFRSDVAGTITGIRFYKGPGNTGTHVGRLWDSGGNLLATATFSGETSSGWQQVSFATPVAIAANTVYVASYHAPSGGYSYDPRYFATAGVDSGPLHALADGVSGGNGLYAYGPSGTFPTGSYNSTNYWVDVVFSATAASAAATGSATAFSLSLASPFAARSGGTASVQAVSAQLPVAVGVLSSSGAVDKKNNSFDSAILDAGPKGAWGTIYYDAVLDQREKMDVKVRTGNTPNPSKSWSKWTSVDDGQALPSTKDRYLQYSIKLKVKGKDRSPVPFEVHVTTNQPGVAAPPSTLETFQAKSLAQSGERVSSGVLDAGRGALWGSLAWTGSQPVDSVRVVEVRTGKTPTVDTTWSEWAPVGNGGGIPSSGRYLTYRTVLLTASTLMMPVGIEFSLTTIAKPAAAKTLSVATASISSDSSGAATAGSVSVLPAEGVAPATTPAVGPQLPTSSGPGRARQADTMSVDPNRGESPASVSVNAPVVIRPHILGTSVLPDRAVLLVGPTAGQTIKPASPPAWWNAREKTSRAAAPVIVGKPQPTQRLAAQGVKKAGATGLVMLSEPE